MSWFKNKEMPEIPMPIEPIKLPEFEPLPELSIPEQNTPIELNDFKEPLFEPNKIEKTRFEKSLESQKILNNVEELIDNVPTEKFIEKIDYEDAMKLIANFDGAIKTSQGVLDSLVELKNNADHKLEEWRTLLEDAERKLVYADRVMFE